MKRNLELVRAMLQSVRDKGIIGDYPLWTDAEIAYHRNMLVSAEFLENKIVGTYELTWEGHEILDGMGTDDEWRAIKQAYATVGLSISSMSWEALAMIVQQTRFGEDG